MPDLAIVHDSWTLDPSLTHMKHTVWVIHTDCNYFQWFCILGWQIKLFEMIELIESIWKEISSMNDKNLKIWICLKFWSNFWMTKGNGISQNFYLISSIQSELSTTKTMPMKVDWISMNILKRAISMLMTIYVDDNSVILVIDSLHWKKHQKAQKVADIMILSLNLKTVTIIKLSSTWL